MVKTDSKHFEVSLKMKFTIQTGESSKIVAEKSVNIICVFFFGRVDFAISIRLTVKQCKRVAVCSISQKKNYVAKGTDHFVRIYLFDLVR